jgi:uncharacterized phage protein gp47/JayE
MSWQEGSWPRTTLELAAELWSDISEVNAGLARARFNSVSTGDWLKLLAINHYDNTPNPARKTQGVARLTAAASAPGPFPFAAGDVTIKHIPTGFTYRNLTAGTLAAGGTLDLTFEAEVAGANRNVQSGTITGLVVSLSGVTVSNPVFANGTWITQLGANAETDDELRERNRTKWATLGYGAPGEAYVHWGRSADAAVKRVSVDDQNPRGPGTTDVIIAGDLGGLPSLTGAVKDYLLGVTDGKGRAPIEARAYLDTFSADELPVIESGVVYLSSTYKNVPSKVEEIEASLTSFYSSVPIGGKKLTATQPGRVLIADKLKSVTKIPGVINFAPLQNTDQVLAVRQVPVLTLNLQYQYI